MRKIHAISSLALLAFALCGQPALAATKKKPVKHKPVAAAAPAPAPVAAASHAPVMQKTRVCDTTSSTTGAVAGAALGAVLGNKVIDKGVLGTAGGAAAGAFAGQAIERTLTAKQRCREVETPVKP